MKLTFEDYLAFIENKLGLQLLDCQKEMLKKICENKTCYYIPARGCGWSMFNAARILLEALKKEN